MQKREVITQTFVVQVIHPIVYLISLKVLVRESYEQGVLLLYQLLPQNINLSLLQLQTLASMLNVHKAYICMKILCCFRHILKRQLMFYNEVLPIYKLT